MPLCPRLSTPKMIYFTFSFGRGLSRARAGIGAAPASRPNHAGICQLLAAWVAFASWCSGAAGIPRGVRERPAEGGTKSLGYARAGGAMATQGRTTGQVWRPMPAREQPRQGVPGPGAATDAHQRASPPRVAGDNTRLGGCVRERPAPATPERRVRPGPCGGLKQSWRRRGGCARGLKADRRRRWGAIRALRQAGGASMRGCMHIYVYACMPICTGRPNTARPRHMKGRPQNGPLPADAHRGARGKRWHIPPLCNMDTAQTSNGCIMHVES